MNASIALVGVMRFAPFVLKCKVFYPALSFLGTSRLTAGPPN